MSYVFTTSERAQIQAAIDASTGLVFDVTSGIYKAVSIVGSNAVPFYQTLSDIISEHISSGAISGTELTGLENAKLWLDVAIGANGGIGIHSAFIRAYTNRQGELRLGRSFTESEMQQSSNAVAQNLANSLIMGDAASELLAWTLPSISQIANIDAKAIGISLFSNLLQNQDTAITNNAAWSGALGFNLLGGVSPFESWRLVQSGDSTTASATPNNLDDFKNLLFAVDAYEHALKAGYLAGGIEFLTYAFLRMFPTLPLPILPADFEAQLKVNFASGNWGGHINDVASRSPNVAPVIKLITDVGVNQFLDMLLGAQLGKPVLGATTDANFLANAQTYFGALTPLQIQNLSTTKGTEYINV